MTIEKNSSVVLNSRPEGFPIPGEHLIVTNNATIDLDAVPLHGGLLVKTIALSVDPYYRLMMDTTYKVGEPIFGHIVGRVIRSELPGYKPGDYIYTEEAPFQEYGVVAKNATQLRRIDRNAATWVQYIGVLGMVTRTAWIGLYALAEPQKGETIYVSTAAGGVGSVVAQLAKQQGLKVIGSAGSDEKVKYLKEELGVDVAFNYKTENLAGILKREGPIDIYWDHVGGKSLETVIDNMKPLGRAIICGYIDQYNTKDNTTFGVKNLGLVNARELTLVGFKVNSLEKRRGDCGFFKSAPELVKEGKIKIREEVRHGLEAVPQFLLDILQGKNVGKAIVIVADE